MDTTQNATIVRVFPDQASAEQAINELKQAGFSADQLGYAIRQGGGSTGAGATNEAVATHEATETGSGAAAGALGGGIMGTIVGAAAALLIPGLGPVVAGGILAASLTGAAVGATAGGLAGFLTGMGVSDGDARYYESEFQSGRAIVTVRAGARGGEASEILGRTGGYNSNNPPVR